MGISGISPKHLAVGAQPLPNSSSAEDIDNNSDDQVDMDVGVGCGVEDGVYHLNPLTAMKK